jgi:hypothetical protein
MKKSEKELAGYFAGRVVDLELELKRLHEIEVKQAVLIAAQKDLIVSLKRDVARRRAAVRFANQASQHRD